MMITWVAFYLTLQEVVMSSDDHMGGILLNIAGGCYV